jgi:uncharacterized protein YcbK (DUF882 family)
VGDLSRYFSRSEFACHCGCGLSEPKQQLINTLEDIRALVKRPVKILSGHRCLRHNKAVGGVINSQHLTGSAADIQVIGIQPKILHDLIDNHLNVGGLGLYATFVHVDIRRGLARWSA